MSTDKRPGTVIVRLSARNEQLPSGPLWTFLEDDCDGLVIASRPDHRHAVLTTRESSVLATVRLSPDAARAAGAALLAVADHATGQETAG